MEFHFWYHKLFKKLKSIFGFVIIVKKKSFIQIKDPFFLKVQVI